MDRLCVFCGSSSGHDPAYGVLAAQLGRALAQRRIGLVYGGGRVGLMGVLADAALAAGGEVWTIAEASPGRPAPDDVTYLVNYLTLGSVVS
jgi:predicted Rossmann-fold nucleotide-binding protein